MGYQVCQNQAHKDYLGSLGFVVSRDKRALQGFPGFQDLKVILDSAFRDYQG